MNNKLFFVINSLQRGGAERAISIVSNALHQQNFEVTIVCLNDADIAFAILPEVKVVSLLKRRKQENPLNRLWYAGLLYTRLIRLLMKEKPFYVVSFMTTSNLWTGLACLLTRIPFVVSEHTTPDITLNTFNYFFRKLSYHIYRKSTAVVVPSIGIAERIKQSNSFRKLNNFKLIRNPINEFPEPSDWKVNDKKFILGVGRLSFVKGFDILIEAYNNINNTGIDLVIAGDGAEYENLKIQIEKLNLTGRVKLVGSKDNLQDYYHQAELFVLPSRNEGYPVALTEAMSFGCACVAVNCDFGPSEIIENEFNGLLVEQNNIGKLSKAIDDLLLNHSLRKKISANAQLINEANSVKNIAGYWRGLLLNLS